MSRRARQTATRLAAPLAGAALLAGCSSPSVTLATRPTDERSAQDLAGLVAGRARCGGLEAFDSAPGRWTFTCGDSAHAFTISVLSSTAAQQAAVRDLARRPWPVKGGAYYLVQEQQQFAYKPDTPAFTPLPVRDLDRFPGAVLLPGGI